MQPLIYYPTFEPPDDNWLKFALIYFEEFRPIIPITRRNLLSEQFRILSNETDLINPINPSPDHGYFATEKAVLDVNKFLDNPLGQSELFNRVNIVRKWQDRNSWNFEIDADKFSYRWGEYCIQNGIGEYSGNGILLSEELAFLFMSYLANEIAYTENTAIITDNVRFDRFTNVRRLNKIEVNKRNQFAKGIIDLKIPKNLSQISFKDLIRFRKKYRNEISAFNSELDKIQQKIGTSFTEKEFIDNYNNIRNEINGIILGLGFGLGSVALASYILLKNPSPEFMDYLPIALETTGIFVTSNYSLRKALSDSKNERYCKKYLMRLTEL